MKPYLFCLCWCLTAAGLRAQPSERYVFEQLPSSIGLTHSSINCIAQDHLGLLWFGTWTGLAMYDGYRVRVFRQGREHPGQLLNDQITTIFEDSHHRLWIGTVASGFYQFDRKTEQFLHYGHQQNDTNSLSDNDVQHIFEDRDGFLWISTENGLNRFDPEHKTFLRITAPANSAASNHYNYACQTADGAIWGATPGGLIRLVMAHRQDQNPVFRHYFLGNGQVAPEIDHFLYMVRPDTRQPNTLLVASKYGIKRVQFDPGSGDLQDIQTLFYQQGRPSGLSNNIVSGFWQNPDGQLWVGTYNGLNLLESGWGDPAIRQFFARQEQDGFISHNSVRALFQDRTGILWIGTEKGINKVVKGARNFQTIRLTDAAGGAEHIVYDLAVSNNVPRQCWAATSNGLDLMTQTGQFWQKKRHFDIRAARLADFSNFISSVVSTSDGRLWLGTKGAGLIALDEVALLRQPAAGAQPTRQWNSAVLGDEHVMSLLDGAGQRLWIGLWDGGLAFIDRTTGVLTRLTHADSLDLRAFPNVVLEQGRENNTDIIWIGTRGNGIIKTVFDASRNQLTLLAHYHYNQQQPQTSIQSDIVNDMLVDRTGRLWAATSNGIAVLDQSTGRFVRIDERQTLPDKTAQSILEDQQGQFWISTPNGLARMKGRPETGSMEVRRYDVMDGLQNNFFNSNCAVMLPEGQLAFGGVEGVNVFAPAAIVTDTTAPVTILTDIYVLNRQAAVNTHADQAQIALPAAPAVIEYLDLGWQENSVTFEFAGLHFAEPGKNRYAYQLIGFDPDWVYTDAERRQAHYTNLPYGDYTFMVKSANADGVWSAPRQVRVTVQPPPWLVNGAFAVYFLIIAAVLYGVYRVLRIRTVYREGLAMERLEREKVEALSQLKMQFFTNLSHELRTPLTLIISPIEQLIHERAADASLQKTLLTMHHNAARLLALINQLLDFRKSEAGVLPIRAAEKDLATFTETIVAAFMPLAISHRIVLRVEINERPLMAWFDSNEMEKVLNNLISNAIKFTPDGGEVVAGIRRQTHDTWGPAFCLTVTDTGPGIPEHEIPHIFDPFHQVANHNPRQVFGGTGIGLSLTKSIVEQHGGQITVVNLPGGGCRFTVWLKTGKDHLDIQSTDAEPTATMSYRQWGINQLEEDPAPAPDHAPVLLIAEDNDDIRTYLRDHFRTDYQVLEAANGEQALQLALSTPPDLVISDIAMPVMDGIELCSALKSDVRTSHIPVVLLTARTSVPFRIQGFETGADEYMSKPFNLQLLRIRIKNLIDSRAQLRALWYSQPDTVPEQVTTNPVDAVFLQQIIDCMHQRIDDADYSVDDLARDMLMSRIQFYRKVKVLTGDSPNALMRNIRLRKAAQLIESKQCSIADAAYQTGFSDLKYFRERFRELFGVLPSEYEK